MIKSLLFLLFSLLIFLIFKYPIVVLESINYSINIFINNVFPTLFISFMLIDFLINYNYTYYLSKIFKFKYSNLFILSMVSGLPSNAKYINNLLDNNIISNKDASVLLSVTYFPNALFIIGSVGLLLFNDIKLGVILLFNIYLSNYILYLFYYKKITYNKHCAIINKKSFSNLLKESILKNIENLIIILGNICIFITISNLILNIFNTPELIKSLLTGIFEMTSGISLINNMKISINTRFILTGIIVSFSGLCVLMQSFSLLSNHKLDYKIILKNKIIIILLNCFTNYLYLIFWH